MVYGVYGVKKVTPGYVFTSEKFLSIEIYTPVSESQLNLPEQNLKQTQSGKVFFGGQKPISLGDIHYSALHTQLN